MPQLYGRGGNRRPNIDMPDSTKFRESAQFLLKPHMPWGATASTPLSKFSSDFYSDAVGWDPIVKRFSGAVDWNECRQVDQGQVVLVASKRRNTLMEWLVTMTILLEAPNNSHYHYFIITYKEVFNMVQRENVAYTVFYVSNYNGEPPDQVASDCQMIIDIVEVLSQNLALSKGYHNMFIKPSVSNPDDEIGKTMETLEGLGPYEVISIQFW
jgi:hypothetical protein